MRRTAVLGIRSSIMLIADVPSAARDRPGGEASVDPRGTAASFARWMVVPPAAPSVESQSWPSRRLAQLGAGLTEARSTSAVLTAGSSVNADRRLATAA
jgi:hypothetical protein